MTTPLIAGAQAIRKRYSELIVTSLIIGFVLGIFTNAPGLFIRGFSNLIIAVMIWAMSFTIKPRHLIGAIRNIKNYTTGLALNFVLAPLVCWILANLLLLGSPEVAVGLILIGVTPCAGMAMVWTGMLEGDTSTAVLIGAGTMLLAPFLIPVLMYALAGSLVIIDMIQMFQSLTLTVLIPVLLGIASRWYADRTVFKNIQTDHHFAIFPAIAGVMAMILMFMVMNTSVQIMLSNPSTVAYTILSVVLVFPVLFFLVWVGSGISFEHPTRIALTYSSGMKNLPIALGIAITSFGGLTPLPIAIGFVFQMLTAVAMYKWLSNRQRKQPQQHQEAGI